MKVKTMLTFAAVTDLFVGLAAHNPWMIASGFIFGCLLAVS